jgi:hypothetical protein
MGMVTMLTFSLLTLLACDDFLVHTPEGAAPDPGAKTLQRLNRTEYDNTVRDLLGTALQPARDFPADDFGYGFDNIGDVLSVSPLHVELYQRATTNLLDELYGTGIAPTERWVVQAEDASATGGALYQATAWVLYGEDEVSTRLYLPYDGTYVLAVRAWPREGRSANVALLLDDAEALQHELVADERVELQVSLSAGHHSVGLAFLDAQGDAEADESVVVDWIEVTGPLDRPIEPPALRDQVLSCDGSILGERDCALQIVTDFGRRAWRRPLTPAELQAQLELYGNARAAGADFDGGVRAALEGLLMSPHFIYRVEIDPDPTSDEPHPVGPYELASRLSYFLWSSTPDERLLSLAATGELLHDEVLAAETRRMLGDPMARALVDNLGGQWLGVRKIEDAEPDPERFPEVDPALVASMQAEAEAIVRGVFLGGRPLSSLWNTTEAELDDHLAAFYGLPEGGVVQLPDRPGLLARAGWLMATSHPTRTSPVKRGQWILDKVLCSPPPPAPAGVSTELGDEEGATVVELLAQHRADPSCASCHDAMDAYGLGLEGFDAIGRARDTYADGQPVVNDGELPDGQRFTGPQEMVGVLAADPRLPRCAVTQTFTYALGRAPTISDTLVLDELEEVVTETDDFEELVVGLVLSRPFRYRRGGS